MSNNAIGLLILSPLMILIAVDIASIWIPSLRGHRDGP
jgi:hypothetical protein